MLKAIKKMQRAPERTRRIVLILFSAGAMFVVVGLWAVYINATVESVPPSETEVAAHVPDNDSDPGIIKTFLAGFHAIIEGIKEKAARTNSWSLTSEERNFQVDTLKAVPVTTLP